jgi:hypothetical protein
VSGTNGKKNGKPSPNGNGKKPGHPRIVETPEEFDRKVGEFEAQCIKDKVPVTFTGMAIHLGFADRRSFYDYEKLPEFSHSVKKARSLVERSYERRLSSSNPVGAIFALKNHGWTDKQRVEHTGADGDAIEITTVAAEARRAVVGRLAGIAARVAENRLAGKPQR